MTKLTYSLITILFFCSCHKEEVDYNNDTETNSASDDETDFDAGNGTDSDGTDSDGTDSDGALLASTFLGGSSPDDTYEPSIAIDPSGNVFVSGYTSSNDFPVTDGAFNSSYTGGTSTRFVAKFDSSLTTVLASTFIGGSGNDIGMGMAIDADGNVYIAGYTTSVDYPTTSGALDDTHNGGQDVYISKFDNNLSTLLSSTYLGGSSNEGQTWPRIDLTVTNEGFVYVSGLTRSTDFPITDNGYDDSINITQGGDVFVAKLDNTLSTLFASTYLGGAGEEWRVSIIIDSNDQVFVCGETESPDFPTTDGAYDGSFAGYSDIFIVSFDENLQNMTASTLLGGNSGEEALAMRLDQNGDVYICGYTKSSDFPTTEGVYSSSFSGGDRDGYVASFDNSLQSLKTSTLLGGSGRDDLRDMIMGPDDILYLTGNSTSDDFQGAVNSLSGGNPHGDAVIVKLAKDMTNLHGSIFVGSNNDDAAYCIAQDKNQDLFAAGITSGDTYPVSSDAFDTSYNGGGDCFVSKIDSNW